MKKGGRKIEVIWIAQVWLLKDRTSKIYSELKCPYTCSQTHTDTYNYLKDESN